MMLPKFIPFYFNLLSERVRVSCLRCANDVTSNSWELWRDVFMLTATAAACTFIGELKIPILSCFQWNCYFIYKCVKCSRGTPQPIRYSCSFIISIFAHNTAWTIPMNFCVLFYFYFFHFEMRNEMNTISLT